MVFNVSPFTLQDCHPFPFPHAMEVCHLTPTLYPCPYPHADASGLILSLTAIPMAQYKPNAIIAKMTPLPPTIYLIAYLLVREDFKENSQL